MVKVKEKINLLQAVNKVSKSVKEIEKTIKTIAVTKGPEAGEKLLENYQDALNAGLKSIEIILNKPENEKIKNKLLNITFDNNYSVFEAIAYYSKHVHRVTPQIVLEICRKIMPLIIK